MDGPRRYHFLFNRSFAPESLPMARLAEYISKLAALLGEKTRVHFVGWEAGSKALVQEVEEEALARVRERLRVVRDSDGPPEAMMARGSLDALLAEDGATADLVECEGSDDRSPEILAFAGASQGGEPEYGPFSESTTLQGVVTVVGGRRDAVPVQLQDGEVVHNCIAERQVARRLAQHIFGRPVRVKGQGRWLRNAQGQWLMLSFRIDEFTLLNANPLGEVVKRLQTLAASMPCPEAPLKTLRELRRGGN